MTKPARVAVLSALTAGGFFVVAEVVCGCFPIAPEPPPTPERRAERVAVDHLAANGGEAWRSSSADVTREADGWRVFVRREPAMAGGHAIVVLDDDLNVVRHFRGR